MPRYNRAERHLIAADPDFARIIALAHPARLASDSARSPYEALVRAVAHQQIHGRAAQAILARLVALFPEHDFPPPDLLLARSDDDIRACGLSRSKLAAIQDIARNCLAGTVPTRGQAARLSDAELIERLVSLRGVGRWTVEMLLIFTLGRPDILPVDDFGVREGYRLWKGLDQQPKPRALAEIGLAWSPYRSTAAWFLWRASERLKGG